MINRNSVLTTLRKSDLVQYLLFFLVIWLAYFIKYRAFGLYEDDYWYVGKPANMNFGELLDLLKFNVLNIEGGQGRFIGFTVPQLLAFLSFKAGGIGGVYILGSFIILLNAVLFYRLGLKLFPRYIAGLAALIFILYPADTTKPLLIHILQLQLSATFVLLALNVYLKGRVVPAFLLAICSMFTYESAYLPFLAAPLFAYPWDRKMIRRMIVHLFFALGVIMVIFVLRKLMGESRVAEIETGETIKQVIISLGVGPVVSVGSFFVAVYEVLLSIKYVLLMVLTGIVLFTVWNRLTEKTLYSYKNESLLNNIPGFRIKTASYETVNQILLLILAAGFMMICSYLFAFTHYPPITLHGRSSSVHLAGSISGTLFVTAVIYLIHFFVSRKKLLLNIFNALLILLLSFLMARGLLIQKDFKAAWTGQVEFWNEVVEETPDVENNTVVIVHVDDYKDDIRQIITYSWALPEGYNQIVQFDESWEYPPKVVIPGRSYEEALACNDTGIYFVPVYPFVFEDREKVYLEDGNFIYLEFANGQATRIDTVLRCDSVSVKTAILSERAVNDFKLKEVGKLFIKE